MSEPVAGFGKSESADAAPTRKNYTRGTHRVVAPERTLERVRPRFREAGITRIGNLTGLDRIGIPVVSVTRPNARSISVAQGKGMSEEAAIASGVMEAIESFHAENVDRPLRLGSKNDLERAGFETCVEGLPRVSAFPFDAATRLLWIEAALFGSRRTLMIPYEVVHTDYRLPLPSGSGRFLMSSNGLASGNHVLEAVCHAVCELVERDATTLWAIGGGAANTATRLVLESVEDPLCREALARFADARVALAVWETTTDLGIPAFLCQAADEDGVALQPLGPRRGMGCHPRREIALLRALTEAAQTRLTVISGARDDLSDGHYDAEREERARREFFRYQVERGARRFEQAPSHEAEDFESDFAFLSERLAMAGHDRVLVVDLSRPAWPVAVVRVAVPGLEAMHDAPGFCAGTRAARRCKELQ